MTPRTSLAGGPAVIAGTCHAALAREFAVCVGTPLLGRTDHFPDGEIHVEVDASAEGRPAIILQSLGPLVGDHLLELLLLADAAWRVGSTSMTAVIPYLAYARHDRRTLRGGALGCRVVADLIGMGRFDRAITVDLHSSSIEGFFPMRVEHLTAVPLLAEALKPRLAANSVIVSPDMGGVKLAELYARTLGLPLAIVHKSRLSASEVRVERIVGTVRGLRPIIVDDIISTAGTVTAACKHLLAEGAVPEVTVVATHGVFSSGSLDRLRELPLRRVVTTDSLPLPPKPPFEIEVVSLAPLLASETLRGQTSRQS